MKQRSELHLTLQTRSGSDTAEPRLRFQGTTRALLTTVRSHTGKLGLLLFCRSEGSLNQHLKLKHPEYYRQQVAESNQNQTLAHLHNMA